MAYSEKAVALRRCQASRADGERCRAWAIWGHPDGLCSVHAGRTSGARNGRRRFPQEHAQYHLCRCAAYDWPHRPAGGLCRWPDPPLERCSTPAGYRGWPRVRRPAWFPASEELRRSDRPTAAMAPESQKDAAIREWVDRALGRRAADAKSRDGTPLLARLLVRLQEEERQSEADPAPGKSD